MQNWTQIAAVIIFLMFFALPSPLVIGLTVRYPSRALSFQSTTACQLNRFLFDPSELTLHGEEKDSISPPSVILPKEDYRTIHAAKVLGLRSGDPIRAGLVSGDHPQAGLLTDEATVRWISEGNVKKEEPLRNGDPPGSLSIRLDNLQEPPPSDQILVSLLLALPRPLQLGRMLPMISSLGVDHLILTRAEKVPKDYFGSHLFRKPEILREKLVEGLCQAGDVRLPKLHIVHNLRRFLETDLDRLFPLDTHARVIAHPQRANDTREPLRMGQVTFPSQLPPRILVAVGPEGGWAEPEELNLFQDLGFQQISLGTRTLRSDCAVISLLSLAHEACFEKQKR